MPAESTPKILIPLLLAIVAALISHLSLTYYFQSTLDRVAINGKFSDEMMLTTTSVNGLGASKVLKERFNGLNGSKKIRIGSGKLNFATNQLIIEFERLPKPIDEDFSKPSYVNIYSMELIFPYALDMIISQRRLLDVFSSEQFMRDGSGVIQIDADSGKATLISKINLVEPQHRSYLALSLLIGLAVFMLSRQTQFYSLPAFQDLNLGRHISSASEFDAINGLRGLAAILVLLSHTAPGFYGIQIGLALLFVLSGFLLSKPFVLDPGRVFNFKNIESYLVKRLRRILPMYYLFIFISFVVSMQLETALRHFLFIQAAGHLWPMTQIFTFYMLLPLVLIATCGLHRLHRLLPLGFLLLSIFAYIEFAGQWKPYYNGRFAVQFYFYAFLMGVLASYIHYGFLFHSKRVKLAVSKYSMLFGCGAAALTLLTIAWAGPFSPPEALKAYISDFRIKCALCALIVVLIINTDKTWFSRILGNWLFRSVGVVGFSFYLLHGMGMEISSEFKSQFLGAEFADRSWWFSLSAFVVTYWMALITYSYVERPFFGFRHKQL